jgi:hypothetical protein
MYGRNFSFFLSFFLPTTCQKGKDGPFRGQERLHV